MKIKDRPEYRGKPRPVVCRADQMVVEAVTLMAERNIGSVVVTDPANQVVGIMTERDLLRRLLHAGKDQHTTPISEIMTADVKVASADDEILDWIRQMSNDRFRHLPVVDDQGNLVALMSQGDFISYTWPEMLLQVTEGAKRMVLKGPQVTMIVLVLAAYLVIVLVIVAGHF